MFGLEYRTLLQRDILEAIDSFDHSVSVEDIKEILGYSNSVTILKTIKELSDLIDETYTDSHYSMKLLNPKKGYYRLERYSTNLQSIFQAIFSQDFAYNLINTLIEKRSISSVEICQELNISESTLQRKVRLINQEIKDYGVYISCSEKVQFKSDELKVRLFSYVFLWSTNRQFSNVSIGYNLSNYLYTSEEVLKYLGAVYDPLKIEILSFWIFIYSNAIARKQELVLTNVFCKTFIHKIAEERYTILQPEIILLLF
ncbi:MAG: helix-turn-helix domain-containing protein [Enterococcus sp.]|uniref:helix-turn-helix domain-containing protein n=1 Tax=Enterococcus sp. TaxID=35783 RepID=UPI0039931FF6